MPMQSTTLIIYVTLHIFLRRSSAGMVLSDLDKPLVEQVVAFKPQTRDTMFTYVLRMIAILGVVDGRARHLLKVTSINFDGAYDKKL